jgi:hypothetical protein
VKKSEAASRSIRPAGRTPVISGRVHETLHRRIQEAAKASGRTMSEELAALATEAFEYRDRYGSVETRRAVEWLTLSFTMAGEAGARAKGLSRADWTDDLDCRRAAALRLCEVALTGFLSPDAREQIQVATALRNRVALPIQDATYTGRKREGGEQ